MFDLILYVPSTIFQLIGTGLHGLNQYLARINVSCSRTQRNEACEAETRGPLVLSQALYHRATALLFVSSHFLELMYEILQYFAYAFVLTSIMC